MAYTYILTYSHAYIHIHTYIHIHVPTGQFDTYGIYKASAADQVVCMYVSMILDRSAHSMLRMPYPQGRIVRRLLNSCYYKNLSKGNHFNGLCCFDSLKITRNYARS
jgi:hypothetical protein